MSTRAVTVRMYNVGFGDCFLLTFPKDDGVASVLIDCGTHPQSTGPRQARRDAVPQIIDDLEAGGRAPRIDVVVVTHRHKDHVSGFESPDWSQVEVGEVWMPWTENPRDPVATGLRERQANAATALDEVHGLLPESPGRALAAGLIANSLTNEKAMTTLHSGFAGSPKRRFLSAQRDPLQIPLLPNVSVHVLGPSRDEKVIKRLEPPGREAWLHLAEIVRADDSGRRPFDDGWAKSWDEFMTTPAFAPLRPGGQIVGAIRRVGGDDILYAAAGLEKVLNGTSLMLVFEIEGILLLCPGDAQWGTWKSVLEDTRARELVGRATFYKVGHHGSYNATPKSFVKDVLADSAWAAIPVAPVERWKKIPNSALLAALEARHTWVVQSDSPPAANVPPNVTVRDNVSVDLAFPLPDA